MTASTLFDAAIEDLTTIVEDLRRENAQLRADNRRLRNADDRPPAPSVRSDTSTAAAVTMRGQTGLLRQRILDWARNVGEFTCAETERALGGTHQSVSARIRELVLEGAIEDTGRRRPNRTSGRMQRIYHLTPPAASENYP